ncbi:hypothetical protein KKH23_09810, partial [Patescibacteria group bacterium]|nr:hypothetical protein [Patescibacteria group bacterium]
MAKDIYDIQRKEIRYFDGVNTIVSNNLAKLEEFSHAENARAKTVGTIEKREGTRKLGNDIVATANKGLFDFENDTATGLFRISTVSATTSVYYLNGSAAWTALTGNGTGLTASQFDTAIAEKCCFLVNGSDSNRYISSTGTNVYTSSDIGDSTTQFDITNPSGNTYRYTYDSTGTDPKISENVAVGDVIHLMAQNFTAGNKGSFAVTAVSTNYFEITNTSGSAESNKTIGTGAIRVVNHATGSLTAHRVNYYKERLYIGDYYLSSNRYQNGIMMSSMPLGITALVDGDHSASITALKVTDIKYIKTNDVLDVYRADTKIGTVIVTAKDSTSKTLTIDSFATDLKSSDELWVAGTYDGDRVYRWADNPESGENVKQYDTFKISGGQNDAITMIENIGNNMMIANKRNLVAWNGSNLLNLDVGVGCVSKNGYTKTKEALWFIGYKGIYITTGAFPQLKSSKMQRYFDGATKAGLEAGAIGHKGESVFASIGDVTLYKPDGSTEKTLSDVVLEYNIRLDNWYIHTGITATQFATYIASDNVDRLEFTSTETNYEVREFLRHELDDYGGDDKEIPFRIDTNSIQLAPDFEKICYPIEVVVEMERGSGLLVFASLDGGDFYPIQGQCNKGCTILKINNKDTQDYVAPPRCRRIKLRDR